MDPVPSWQKIPTRLRGTNFGTRSAHFAPSFITQPNGPKCTPIVRNTPKHQFRVQWDGSGAFGVKNSDATSCSNFCTSSACFAPSFVRQPNDPKCVQLVRNAPKHQFRIQGVGSGAFVKKNSDATSWDELLHLFGPFRTDFRKATKRSRMYPNGTKRTKTSV